MVSDVVQDRKPGKLRSGSHTADWSNEDSLKFPSESGSDWQIGSTWMITAGATAGAGELMAIRRTSGRWVMQAGVEDNSCASFTVFDKTKATFVTFWKSTFTLFAAVSIQWLKQKSCNSGQISSCNFPLWGRTSKISGINVHFWVVCCREWLLYFSLWSLLKNIMSPSLSNQNAPFPLTWIGHVTPFVMSADVSMPKSVSMSPFGSIWKTSSWESKAFSNI